MRTIAAAFAISLAASSLAAGAALAESVVSTIPADSKTVTNYYQQSVYDAQENNIGTIDDVLIDKTGKVTVLIIGVGGIVGAPEKDVAVSFADVRPVQKDNKWRLTLDTTKDALQNAIGYKYDRSSTTWVADK